MTRKGDNVLPLGPRGARVRRVCLRCDREFWSYGNRICSPCTELNRAMLKNNTWEALVYGVGGEATGGRA